MTETAAALIAEEQVELFSSRVRAIRESLHHTVVGQDQTIDNLLVCVLTGSHIARSTLYDWVSASFNLEEQ